MSNLLRRMFKDAKTNHDLHLMESLHRGNPNDPFIKFEYARLLFMYKKISEAKILFLELLDTRNHDYAMLELGKIEAYLGNTEKAKDYFSKLKETGDKYATLEYGKILMDEGKIDEARSMFLSVLKYNLPSTKLYLGRLEASVGNIKLARQYFRSLEKDNNSRGVLEQGRLEGSLGNISEARMLFKMTLSTESQIHGIIELGLLEARCHNYKTAENYLNRLIGTTYEPYAYRLLSLLFIKKQDYIKAYEVIRTALKKKYKIDNHVLVAVSKELNIFFPINYGKIKYSYSMNQLINYDESLGVEHVIEGHRSGNNQDFNDDIDLEILFDTIKNYLTDDNKTYSIDFNDVYVIPYPNIGKNGEQFIRVVTLPNTKDIITMYPVYGVYEYIDVLDTPLVRVKDEQ